VAAFVSGRKRAMAMNVGAASHRISHRLQCQFFAVIEKPDINGPMAGPRHAESAQSDNRYGILTIENMSLSVAPPVASAGDPKKPIRNRRTRRPPMLFTNDVGIASIVKMANVAM